MQLAALPRWQWVVIALVLGATIGLINDSADSQLYGLNVQGYGMQLPDQQQFENGLVQDYNGIRLFNNPMVYPHWTVGPNGQRTLVYIVAGQYWDGREEVKDGKSVAEWRPRCIITATPYKPRIGVADENGSLAQEYPSVIEFLDALHRAYKVNYRYAWWALHPVLVWIVGSLILIGGIWPTLANLLAYGTLTRPREVKAVSLWNIRKPKVSPSPKPVFFTGGSGGDDDLTAPSDIPIETTARPLSPVPVLAAAPLELSPEQAREHRDYGADKDDFYPTERHVPRPKPPL